MVVYFYHREEGCQISEKLRLNQKDKSKTILAAVWKRRPKKDVLIHSDQGSQYGSGAWIRLCEDPGFIPSMSNRGNGYDNAALESFNGTLKKERVRGKSNRTREEAKTDIFDYIELFYNPRCRHSYLGYMSPMKFEELKIGAG